jgi:cupin 2 domain-containing protein
MQINNLFRGLKPDPRRELFEPLLERPGLRLERIVSSGQTTPPGEWLRGEQDEWVALLEGTATLCFQQGAEGAAGEELELRPGDFLLIPAGCQHRVAFTSRKPPAVWLALHVAAR